MDPSQYLEFNEQVPATPMEWTILLTDKQAVAKVLKIQAMNAGVRFERARDELRDRVIAGTVTTGEVWQDLALAGAQTLDPTVVDPLCKLGAWIKAQAGQLLIKVDYRNEVAIARLANGPVRIVEHQRELGLELPTTGLILYQDPHTISTTVNANTSIRLTYEEVNGVAIGRKSLQWLLLTRKKESWWNYGGETGSDRAKPRWDSLALHFEHEEEKRTSVRT